MSLRDDLLAAGTREEQADVLDAAFTAAGYTPSGASLRDRLLATSTLLQWINVLDAACVAAGFTIEGQSVRDQLLAGTTLDELATTLDNVFVAQIPYADFSASVIEGEAPLEVEFTDESTNTPDAWLWEKNDGEGWVPFDGTPTAQNPIEEFSEGTWSVRLTATNLGMPDSETKTDYIEATAEEPSYVGPLDLVPGAVVAYGQRAMSAAMCGQPYATLRRSSDDAEQQFSFAADGSIDAAAITAWAGGDAFAKIWNDGSGNSKDGEQTTVARQPKWIAGSTPALEFIDGADFVQLIAADVALAGGSGTAFVVANLPDVPGQRYFFEISGDHSQLDFDAKTSTPDKVLDLYAAANDWNEDLGAQTLGASILEAYALFEVSYSCGAVIFKFNGATVTNDFDFCNAALTQPISGPLSMGLQLNGQLKELLLYQEILSVEEANTLRQNIAAYYGITLS